MSDPYDKAISSAFLYTYVNKNLKLEKEEESEMKEALETYRKRTLVYDSSALASIALADMLLLRTYKVYTRLGFYMLIGLPVLGLAHRASKPWNLDYLTLKLGYKYENQLLEANPYLTEFKEEV